MITMLKDSQGHKLESFEAISNELVNHFVGSLGAIDENVEVVQDNLLKEVLGVELTVDMQNSLVSPVTNEEIKDVQHFKQFSEHRNVVHLYTMAWSAVSSAVITICKLLGEEAVYLWGVEKQVDRLQTELKWMRSSLMVADVKQDEDERIRLWVAEIRELAYDAEDVIEDFVLRVGSKRKGGVSGCIKRSACILNEGREVHETRSKIEEIIERILDLVRRLQVYGVKGLRDGEGSSYLSVRRELRRPYPHIMDQNVVGLNDVIKELVPKLVEERTQCRLVSIWGMGDRSGYLYELPCLNDEESWELLQKVAFPPSDSTGK
ncbi:hypothetical protein V6N11_079200 [Hibiscus sabdariffa]|uniref:Disease resistance N-terminal domain-containing protein n=1 Tax=Hibiscus sabdariffa TaxID=183260 RepID=A0ABR2RUP2_9ROSI